jgi:hypothetical protein
MTGPDRSSDEPVDPSKTADQQPGARPPKAPKHDGEGDQSDEGGDSDTT